MDPSKRSNSFNLANGSLFAYYLIGALVLISWSARSLVECQEQITVESRDLKPSTPNSENEISDTLKYLEKLEKLDQYWSEVARPRFGRSEYKQPLLGFRMQQQQQRQQQRPRQLGRPLYEWRAAAGSGNLADLIGASLAQRYNSNDAY